MVEILLKREFLQKVHYHQDAYLPRLVVDGFYNDEVVPVDLRVGDALALGLLLLAPLLRLLVLQPANAVVNLLKEYT